MSVIHALVYEIIHENVRLRKTESEMAGDDVNGGRCQLSKESDDTLFWYCGVALQRMIKLRKETLAGKKSPGRFVKMTMIIVQALLPCLPPSKDFAIVAGKEN